jgi:hypothetical protein
MARISNKQKRFRKIIRIIAITCIVIMAVEIMYLIYVKCFKKPSRTYFDGTNAITYNNKYYATVGSNNDNDDGYERAKITLYNKSKNKLWEKVYNKGYNGAYFGIAIDTDNATLAVGSYEASKSEHKDTTRSALFVKYDKDGNIVFEKEFQVLGNSKFTNVKVVDDGYIVVGQSIYENSTLGLSDEGGAFIIKYDKAGNIVWKENYGGSKSGVFNDLVILNDNIYVVGKNYARVGVIAKYDMNGNLIKDTEYKSTDTFGFTGITVVDNNLVVVGGKKVSADENSWDIDGLLVKYDSDCNYVGEMIYTGKGIERYNQVMTDSDNNIVAIGTTGVYNKKKSTKDRNVFSYNGIIGKYKANLKLVEVEEYGDELDDYFTDILEVNNQYVVTGYSAYKDNGYMSKFITYSKALKVLDVK